MAGAGRCTRGVAGHVGSGGAGWGDDAPGAPKHDRKGSRRFWRRSSAAVAAAAWASASPAGEGEGLARVLPAEDDSQVAVWWEDGEMLSTGLVLLRQAVGGLILLSARLRAEPPRTLCSSCPSMPAASRCGGGGRPSGDSPTLNRNRVAASREVRGFQCSSCAQGGQQGGRSATALQAAAARAALGGNPLQQKAGEAIPGYELGV